MQRQIQRKIQIAPGAAADLAVSRLAVGFDQSNKIQILQLQFSLGRILPEIQKVEIRKQLIHPIHQPGLLR
jgi:hypothetical protein